MKTVKIGGKEYAVSFMVEEMIQYQDEIGPVSRMGEQIFASLYDSDVIKNLVKTVRICVNGGLKDAGQDPVMTDEVVRRKMSLKEMTSAQETISLIVMDSMEVTYEAPAVIDEQTGDRDIGLEEIRKKKEPKAEE